MKQADSYQTIEQTAMAELRERGSRFIAYAFPVQSTDDFKKHLAHVRHEHPKATHHCFAYRLGQEGLQFRVSDDGEPAGTAGKPILGQLDSRKLTNTLVVVVRYFGGTLLGVPGLIQAYKSAAALVLQTTPVIIKLIRDPYLLQFNYPHMNEVMKVLKQTQSTIQHKETGLFCRFSISIPRNRREEVIEKFKEIYEVTLTPVEGAN